jgi:hypothetical protein
MSSRYGVRHSDQMADYLGDSLSLDKLLYIAPSGTVLVLHLVIEKYHLLWCRASDTDRQTVCYISHDMTNDHVGVTNIEHSTP